MTQQINFPQSTIFDAQGNLSLEWREWLLNPQTLTAKFSVALGVISGGTGLSAGTSGGILGFTSANTIACSPLLTNNAIVLGGGAGSTPSTPLGIGTAGQLLQAGATPAWTTATYPGLAGTVANVIRSDGTNFQSAALAAADLSNGTIGTGKVVLETSPVLTTPNIGVAAATSINKVTLTGVATGATLTLSDGKTLSVINTLTLSGADASTLNIGSGGTLGSAAFTASTAYLAAGGTAVNSSQLLGSTWAVPAAIGSTTPNSGTFTSMTNTGIRADQAYSYQTPATGFSITIGAGITTLILNPAGTLATGTIVMPASPVDGQEVRITSTQTITGLTVSPNTGQSVSNAPTTFSPSTTGPMGYEFIYRSANTTWYRLQ